MNTKTMAMIAAALVVGFMAGKSMGARSGGQSAAGRSEAERGVK